MKPDYEQIAEWIKENSSDNTLQHSNIKFYVIEDELMQMIEEQKIRTGTNQ